MIPLHPIFPIRRIRSPLPLPLSAEGAGIERTFFRIGSRDADDRGASRSFSRGFTLIELLVVLAILLVLGALAFPALQSALAKARIITCASNLKQIFLGLESYAADNNNCLPPSYAPSASGGSIGTVPYFLSPYIKGYDQWGGSSNSHGVYVCPEMLRQPGINTSVSHYAVNALLWNGYTPTKIPLTNSLYLSLFSKLSQTILMGDNNWPAGNPASTIDNQIQPGVDGRNTVSPISSPPSHARGGANLLFADGHVEYWSDTSVLCTNINYRNHGSSDLWNIQK